MVDVSPSDEEAENEDLESHEAEHGHTDVHEVSTKTIPHWSGPPTEIVRDVSRNDLTPSTSVSSHACTTGYSVLVDIQYPFQRPTGALRYIKIPSRQNLLQVVAQVLATNEPPNDPNRFMKSLSIRKGDTKYDILGYPEDDIRSLLDDILEVEKLIKIECVYNI
ncbi:hypothetical protein N7501_007589 [Penicillium viridicatum]|nr:hypothetical protein N7501_007589 [Penicillium viridicatum]